MARQMTDTGGKRTLGRRIAERCAANYACRMDGFLIAVVAIMLAVTPFVIRTWKRQYDDIKTKPSEDRARKDRFDS